MRRRHAHTSREHLRDAASTGRAGTRLRQAAATLRRIVERITGKRAAPGEGSPVAARRRGSSSGAPTISVVITTLNRCDYLERTLLALREQTYEKFEVIVVNGPSHDGTEQMLSSFRDQVHMAT
jgi:glycosyl transferase family 2